ncbi:MAG: hypothetical protein AAF550_13040, partial [Myxococcota bacterium]
MFYLQSILGKRGARNNPGAASSNDMMTSRPSPKNGMLWLLWFGIGTTVCSGVVPTFSGSPPKACAQSAQDTLRASHDAAMRVLRRPVSERRSAQLDEIFQRLLDFDALAKRSLATHWETIEVH